MENFNQLRGELTAVANYTLNTIQNIQRSVYPQQFASNYSYIIAFLCANDENEIFQRDIEREFNLNRSTVSNILKELEKQGLIERKAVSDDARLKRVIATQGAHLINDACNKEIANLLQMLTREIADDEIESFINTLQKFKANANEIKERGLY